MVGNNYLLVTNASSDGEASSVVCVNLEYQLGPNVYFIQADGWKGIKQEGYWSVGGIFGLGFGGE